MMPPPTRPGGSTSSNAGCSRRGSAPGRPPSIRSSVMGSALGRIDAHRQLLVADDGLYIRDTADGRMTLYRPLEADNAATRSNDARVHPSGTFWIGTMGRQAERGLGAIYALHRGELSRLYDRDHDPERDLLLAGRDHRLFRRHREERAVPCRSRCGDRPAARRAGRAGHPARAAAASTARWSMPTG